MTDSWRNILERAAGNLSFELDQEAGRGRPQPAGWPAPPRHVPRGHSLAQSRELLARELEAIAPPPFAGATQPPAPRRPERAPRPSRPSITQAVKPASPAVRPTQTAPRKSGLWQALALSVSMGSLVLTAYAFFTLLR